MSSIQDTNEQQQIIVIMSTIKIELVSAKTHETQRVYYAASWNWEDLIQIGCATEQ